MQENSDDDEHVPKKPFNSWEPEKKKHIDQDFGTRTSGQNGHRIFGMLFRRREDQVLVYLCPLGLFLKKIEFTLNNICSIFQFVSA